MRLLLCSLWKESSRTRNDAAKIRLDGVELRCPLLGEPGNDGRRSRAVVLDAWLLRVQREACHLRRIQPEANDLAEPSRAQLGEALPRVQRAARLLGKLDGTCAALAGLELDDESFPERGRTRLGFESERESPGIAVRSARFDSQGPSATVRSKAPGATQA